MHAFKHESLILINPPMKIDDSNRSTDNETRYRELWKQDSTGPSLEARIQNVFETPKLPDVQFEHPSPPKTHRLLVQGGIIWGAKVPGKRHVT